MSNILGLLSGCGLAGSSLENSLGITRVGLLRALAAGLAKECQMDDVIVMFCLTDVLQSVTLTPVFDAVDGCETREPL